MNIYLISLEETMVLFNEPNLSHRILLTVAVRNAIELVIRQKFLYAFQAPGITFELRDKIISDVKEILGQNSQPTSVYESLKADMAQLKQYEKRFDTAGWFKKLSLAFKIKMLQEKEYPLQDILRGIFCEFKNINRMTVLELVGNDLIVDEDEEI